ncbi:hypothetical protein Tco_0036972 [Tanacetum coccineum]
MILGRQFLATIHAEIDIFNKEISLGIEDDRVTFNMDKKIHNFATPFRKVYMVNSIHNDEPPNLLDICSRAPSYESPQSKKFNNMYHQNNNDNYMQEQSSKKVRMLKLDINTLIVHFCKLVKQNCNGVLKKKHKGGGLSFLNFLLVRYGDIQGNDLIWDNRYAEWCSENCSPDTPL